MTDATFDLVSKIYDEMTNKFDKVDHMLNAMNQRFDGIDRRLDGMDQRFDGIDQRFDGIDRRLDGMEKRLESKADKLDIVRLENKMDTNFKALYDGYIQNSEQISRVETKVDALAAKVERQEVVIRVMKGGRDTKVK